MEGSTRSSMGTLSSWIVLRRGCWRRKRGIEGDAVVRCNVTSWSKVGNQQAIIFPPYHRFRRTRQEDEGTSLLQRGSILHNNPCDLKWNNHSLNQSPPEGGLMTCWNTNQPRFGTLSLICWKHTCFFGFRLFVCFPPAVGALFDLISVLFAVEVRPLDRSVRALFITIGQLELSLFRSVRWNSLSVGSLFILMVGWISLYFDRSVGSLFITIGQLDLSLLWSVSWISLYVLLRWIVRSVGALFVASTGASVWKVVYWQRSKPMTIVSIWNKTNRIDIYWLALQVSNWIASDRNNRHWWGRRRADAIFRCFT